MKNINILLSVFVFATTLLTGCKKDDDPVKPDPKKTAATQSDQTAKPEVDEVMDQVNDFISNKIGGGNNARLAAYNLPCGVVSVDSSTLSGGYKVYKLNYGSRTPCGSYKYKSGEVSFNLKNAPAFNQAGAEFWVTFTNYVVDVEIGNTISTIKLNGNIIVTNVNGGYVYQVVTNSSTVITHKLRGILNITYANNEVRVRQYYQLRTYSNASSGWAGLTLTVAGDSTSTDISEAGKTYDGNYDFVTHVPTDFVWSNCGSTWAGPYLLKQGNARMDVTIPLVASAYIDVTAGYYWDYNNAGSTPTLLNNCTSNAYKINTVIGAPLNVNTTAYQLY